MRRCAQTTDAGPDANGTNTALAASSGDESELDWHAPIEAGASDDGESIYDSEDGLAMWEREAERVAELESLQECGFLNDTTAELLMLQDSMSRGERELATRMAASPVNLCLPTFEVTVHIEVAHLLGIYNDDDYTDDCRREYSFHLLRPLQELFDMCLQDLDYFEGGHHNPAGLGAATVHWLGVAIAGELKSGDTLYSSMAWVGRFELRARISIRLPDNARLHNKLLQFP